MSSARYPVRLIALGPPYDDGTVPERKKPDDARGATPPSNGLRTAAAPGKARSTNGSDAHYDPDHHPRLLGQPDTTFDRVQRENGLVKLDNEVLRDLLEVAWTTITTLAPTGQNAAADAFRARVWAHLHDEEAECPACDHYVVNHEAAGPCAVEGCDCQNTCREAE